MFDNAKIPLIDCKDVFIDGALKNKLNPEIKIECSKEITFATFSDVIPSPTNPTGNFDLDSIHKTFKYFETSAVTGKDVNSDGTVKPKAGWQIQDDATYKFYYKEHTGTYTLNEVGAIIVEPSGKIWFNQIGTNTVQKNEVHFRFFDDQGSAFKLPVAFDMEWIDAGASYTEEIYFTAINPDGVYSENEVKGNISKGGMNGVPGADKNPNKVSYMRNATTVLLGGKQIHIDTRIALAESKSAGTALENTDDVKIDEPARKMDGFDLSYENFASENGTAGAQGAAAWFVWSSKGYALPSPQKVCIEWKIRTCKQEIIVNEYQSACSGLDCNYKKTETTKLWRKGFLKNDNSYLWSRWFWQDRNLKDLKDTYQFDGNKLTYLETDFPWIVEGSYRKELQLVEMYLYADCCSDCGDTCKKQDGCKYELVVPRKFIPKHCMDKEQPKSWKNCLRVERPHWVKTCNVTESNLCNWTAYSSHCQVRFNYLNKQQLRLEIIKGANMSLLEDFLRNHKFDKINNCGMSAILNTTDKTIYGAINGLGLELSHKIDKSINLQKIASVPYSKISKI